MPRTKLGTDTVMETGWGDRVHLEKDTQVEVLDVATGRVEVLSGRHFGRLGRVPIDALSHHQVLMRSEDLVKQWVALQCVDLPGSFQHAFTQELTQCLFTRGTLLLRALNHALKVATADSGDTPRDINASAQATEQAFSRTTDSDYVLLFRFYSGDAETLLPPCRQKPVPGRVEPSQPARLEQERVINPRDLLRKKQMARGGGTPSAASTSREVAHAHQQGQQAQSEFVSCGYRLPRLLRTPSYKVRVIMFGHASGSNACAGYAQATHLGVFLVPRSKLGEVIWKTGEMACLEREITFKGDGLSGYELFTLLNPFHPSSPHHQSGFNCEKLAYF